MSSLTIAWFPFLESKSVLADLDRLLLSDSQTNMWNQKQIAWVELKALMAGDVLSVNGYTGAVNLNIADLADIPVPWSPGIVLTWNGTAFVWVPAAGASGETNLMSNVSTGLAIGVYKQKTSVTFEMYGILGKQGVESSLSWNNIELNFKVSTLTNTQKTDLTAALLPEIKAGISIEDLSNTTITTPNTNDVLTWNGTIWINQAVSALGFNINSLSIVTTGVAANDYIPMYSASLATQKKITITNLATLMGITADASTTVKGLTKLSVAPAATNNPIAVGDNDPRMTQFGYDAVVAATWGSHTTLSSALADGKQKILIKSGTYADTNPAAITVGQNVYIHCEGSVIMNIDASGSAFCFSINGSNFTIDWGTWNVTQNQATFSFVYTTSTRSSIYLKGLLIQNILNYTNSDFYLVYSNSGGAYDSAIVEGLRVYCTLSSATSGCALNPANGSNFSNVTFTGCRFEQQVSGGGILANGDNVRFASCSFYANGSGTTRNYLAIANAENCIGYWSKDLVILNCTNCGFYGNNQTTDTSYNVGTSAFRMKASGMCTGNQLDQEFLTGNGLKINSSSVFTGNRVSGGAHIQIGQGDTNWNLKTVVTGNWFSQAFAQSSVAATVLVKQRNSMVCGNTFESNYFAGGSGTAQVLTIHADADYSIVSNNIFAGMSSAIPSITDSSTGSVKVDNVFSNAT